MVYLKQITNINFESNIFNIIFTGSKITTL
jgi:hypothetical protein